MQRSHVYDLSAGAVARVFLPPLGCLGLGAVLLHTALSLGLLPDRPITLYADETVLRHQVRAGFLRHPAEIILVGDSTCHTAVDAAQLTQLLPKRSPVINLGLIIGIDLGSYAQTVRDFSATNPGQVRWVVLLLCPSRMSTQGDATFWRQLRDDIQQVGQPAMNWRSVEDLTGGTLLRERLASRLLPRPLRGKVGDLIGFTVDLDRYMTEHNGSVVDFGEFVPRPGSPHRRASVCDTFPAECRDFRNRLPGSIKLAVGLTPGPAVLPLADVRAEYAEYLEQLAALLKPDWVLTNLPAFLPSHCFSPSAHLNASGQQIFTAALARELTRMP